MDYIKQIGVICSALFIGLVIRTFIPFPMPAAVYGMTIMFIFLNLKIVKPESLQGTSDTLLKNMSLFLLPPCLGIAKSLDLVMNQFFVLMIFTMVSTLISLVIVGLTVQLVQKGVKNVK